MSRDEQGGKKRKGVVHNISMKMFLPDTHETRDRNCNQDAHTHTQKRRRSLPVSFNRTGSLFFSYYFFFVPLSWGFNALLLCSDVLRCWGGANNNGMKAGNNDSAQRVTKERGKEKKSGHLEQSAPCSFFSFFPSFRSSIKI